MKKILIITTGGTILSSEGENGLKPTKLESLLKKFDFSDMSVSVEYLELMSLDSSNIQPEEWRIIANNIDSNKDNFDGVVILHGTDTLAYTASMLSFMLKGIHIPVVLTGSQVPISNPLSDAIHNTKLAITMASSSKKGVFVAFDKKIILASRVSKIRTIDFNAFESINVKPYAILLSTGLNFNNDILLPNVSYDFSNKIETNVFLLKLTPTTNPNIIDLLIDNGIKGIVIEAFGLGGLQFVRRDFVSKIKYASEKNIPIVLCSQCLFEESNFSVYEVGKLSLEYDIIEAMDMTSEAAITKLMYGLANTSNFKDLKDYFYTNISGEISLQSKTRVH